MNIGERGVVSTEAITVVDKGAVDALAAVLVDDPGVSLDIQTGTTLPLRLVEVISSSLPQFFLSTEALRLGVGERGDLPGPQEDWEVANDLTSVNGHLPWSRLHGTNWTVQNKRAKLIPGSGVPELGRCDRDVGTADMEVSCTIPSIARVDSPLAVAGVCARVDPGGAFTFYVARAVSWNGGDHVDVWRVVADVWTRIIGPVYGALPGASSRLRLRVTGAVTPIVQLWIDDVLLGGPLADAGGITTGARFGILGEINSGTQAVVEIDDARAVPVPGAATPVTGADGIALRLTESVIGTNVARATEVLAIGLGEWPVSAFEARAGAEALSVGVGERAAVVTLNPVAGADVLAAPLSDTDIRLDIATAAGLAVQVVDAAGPPFPLRDTRASADGVALGLAGETSAVASSTSLVDKAGTDSVAAALAEAAVPVTVTSNAVSGADSVAVRLVEAAGGQAATVLRTDAVAIRLAGETGTTATLAAVPVGLVRMTGDALAVSGGQNDAVVAAGPTTENADLLAGPTAESVEIGAP